MSNETRYIQVSEDAVKKIEGEMSFKGAATYYPKTGRIYTGRAPDLVENNFKGAQMVLPSDISAVKAQVILEEVLGRARLAYNLRQAARVFPASKIEFSIDKYTNLTAHRVEPLEEPEISAIAGERLSFALYKDVTFIVVSDEARMSAAHDILGMSVEDAGPSIADSENVDIKTAIEAATAISGADWATVTSGRSANSPYEDLYAAADAIVAAGKVEPDTVIAHYRAWGDFFGNDFVKGQLVGAQMPQLQARSFSIPGLPGWKGISEPSLTNTIAIVTCTNPRFPGYVLADGPTESARFRNELAGYDAFLIRHWYQSKLLLATATSNTIRKLTGVHA